MNGLKRLMFNLKRVMKNYLNPLLPSVAFLYSILTSKYQNAIGFLMFYWCYKRQQWEVMV